MYPSGLSHSDWEAVKDLPIKNMSLGRAWGQKHQGAIRLPLFVAQIRRGLLEWYDEHHRVLPWRRNFHSKRPSQEGDLPGASLDLPLDEFMYYVMVCEVRLAHTCSLSTVTGTRHPRNASHGAPEEGASK